MGILRESSEDEMILEFLQAEYIKRGGAFPRLFFLTSDYENFDNVKVNVGKCSEEEPRKWM